MEKLQAIFKPNVDKYQGIRPINIWLMRFTYALIAVFVGQAAWSELLNFQGEWNPISAVAWSVWAAFSLMSVIGVFHTIKLIPLLLFEVIYKLIWLVVVALPLWQSETLRGSSAEGLAADFVWVILPIVALPWGYVCKTYVLSSDKVSMQ